MDGIMSMVGLAVAIGVLLACVGMILLWRWFKHWCSRMMGPDPHLAAIHKPIVKFEGFDPSLRERTAVRRQQAAHLTHLAAKVASSPAGTEPRLRVVSSTREQS